MLESVFNKIAVSLKKTLQCKCFPVSFMDFFKKPYLQNTTKELLLLIPPFQPMFYSFITPVFFQRLILLLLIIAVMRVKADISSGPFLLYRSKEFKEKEPGYRHKLP